jgi:hypothetical protein
MSTNGNGTRKLCRLCRLPTWGGGDLCPDCQQHEQPAQPVKLPPSRIWSRLAAPFDPGEVKTRPQGRIQLSYVTARTVMNRLDNVLSPENWWDSYLPMDNSVLCTLTIRLPDGSTVSKQDAGGYAGMTDQGDDDKSGYSDSFKRAAVKFGVGRYLYRDGVPSFASPTPVLNSQICETPPPPATNGNGEYREPGSDPRPKRQAPRTGPELDAYVRTCKIDPGLVLWIRDHFPRHPHRPKDWTDQQVMAAWPDIREYLKACKAARHGATT